MRNRSYVWQGVVLLFLAACLGAVEPKIAVGDGFCVLLAPDGTVWTWGRNDYGQLGQGGATDVNAHPTATRITTLSNVIDVAAGKYHALALTASGLVYSWGRHDQGQMGNNAAIGGTYTSPTSCSYSGFIAIAAGGNHSLALSGNGQVYGWGDNSQGQLGIAVGNTTDRSLPNAMNNVGLANKVIGMAGGLEHSAILLADGTVWTTGDDTYGQLGVGGTAVDSQIPVQVTGLANVKAVAAGDHHCAVLLADGTLRTWGRNHHGQCGFSSATTAYFTPQAPVYGWKLRSVGAGGDHTVAIEEYGFLVRCGANASGELVTGGTADMTALGYTESGTRMAAAGSDSILILKANGQVWACGANASGQLGNGGTSPSSALALCTAKWPMHQAIAIAAQNYGGLLLKADGTVWSWGYDGYGQLGDDANYANQLVPVQVTGLTDVIAIAAGDNHGLALLNNGNVWAWGMDSYGQLGNNAEMAHQPTPVQVTGLPTCTAIAAGRFHSAVVSATGSMYAWGYDYYGQLGNDAANTNQPTPALVSGMTNAKAVACGGYHTLAVKADGSLWSWGYDGFGQLGDNPGTGTQYTPVPVPAITQVIAIAAGAYHSAAITAPSRTLYTWGRNADGQLGLGVGNTTTMYEPALVGILWTGITLGSDFTLARYYDNNAFACGDDTNGQLGDDVNYVQKEVLTPVLTLSSNNVHAIAAGSISGFVLRPDGMIRSWGYGTYGSLANNDTAKQPTPVDAVRQWLPEITLAATDPAADENFSDPGTFTVTTSMLSPGTIPVTFSLTGAALPSDYTASVLAPAEIAPAAATATITITPIDDQYDEDPETVVGTVSASNLQYRIGSPSADTITINDNDTRDIIVTGPSGPTSEDLTQVTFNIRLATKPTAPVTIGFTNPRPDEGSLSTSSVTLNPDSAPFWNTGANVTITGVNDDIADGPVTYDITTNKATSTDLKYKNFDPLDVTVTNNDNDTAGYIVSSMVGRASEKDYGDSKVISTITGGNRLNFADIVNIGAGEVMVGQWVYIITANNNAWQQVATINNVAGNKHVILSGVGLVNEAGGLARFLPTFSVRLRSQPRYAVTIPITIGSTQVSLSTSSLTFEPDDANGLRWDRPQLAYLWGNQDDVDDGTQSVTVNLQKPESSQDTTYKGLDPPDRTCSCLDDDESVIVVSSEAVMTKEGAYAGTYFVSLGANPQGTVVVDLTGFDATNGVAIDTDPNAPGDQHFLTFSTNDWQAKPVTVTANDDPDIEGDGPVIIAHTINQIATADPLYDVAPVVNKSVSVIDNDAPGVVVSPTSSGANRVTVQEGSTATVRVWLASRPQSTKKVRIKFTLAADPEAVGVTLASPSNISVAGDVVLEWAYGTYQTSQDLVITGTDDAGYNIERFLIAGTLVVQAGDALPVGEKDANYYRDVAPSDGTPDWSPGTLFSCEEIDDDRPGIKLIVAGSMDVTEADPVGTAKQYNVQLNVAPSAGTMVAVAIATNGEVEVTPATLFFTDAGGSAWNVSQQVTVKAIDDRRVEPTLWHLGQLTHSVLFTTDILPWDANPGPAGYSPSAGAGGPVPSATLSVSVLNNDTAGIAVVPTAGLITTEGGGAATFSLALTGRPVTGTTVRVKLGYQGPAPEEAEIDISGQVGSGSNDAWDAWIDFTDADWDQARTITIRGLDDDSDDGDRPFTIVTSVDAGATTDASFDNLNPPDVQGVNIDDDQVEVLVLDAALAPLVNVLSLDEAPAAGNHTTTFKVRLASKPTDAVTVTFRPDQQVTVSPPSITFVVADDPAAGSWETPVTVTVTATDDAVQEDSPHSATIQIDVAGGDYTGVVVGSVRASIADNDTAGITVGALTGTVSEVGPALIGPHGTSVTHATTPSVGHVVTMPAGSLLDAAHGFFPEIWLRFTGGGPNSGRRVKVIAVDDAADRLSVADELATATGESFEIWTSFLVAMPGTGGTTVQFDAGTNLSAIFDLQYLQFVGDGVNSGRVVQVAIGGVDDANDQLTIIGNLDNIVAAGGEAVVFFAGVSVVLDTQPTGQVDVDVVSSATGVGGIFPSRLTFTAQNWDQPQMVGVFGVDDEIDDGDLPFDVRLQPAVSADPTYHGMDASDRTATVLDDDRSGIELSGGTLTDPLLVDEGGGLSSVTVHLTSQPTGQVRVVMTGIDGAQLNVTPQALVFTDQNWQTPQRVTVVGRDGDGAGGAGQDNTPAGVATTFTVAIDDANTADATYDAVADATVHVRNLAANAAPVIGSVTDQLVVQNNNGQPVVVALGGIGAGQAGEEAQTLTITASATPSNLLADPVVTYVSPGVAGSLSIPLVTDAFGVGTVTVTVTDDDTVAGAGTARSTQISFVITVAAVVADLNGPAPGRDGMAVTYTEGSVPVQLASAAALEDSRGAQLTGLTAVLSVTPDNGGGTIRETLAVEVGSSGLTAAFDDATRTLTMSGNASAGTYQQVLRTLTYHHAGEDPTAGLRTVTIIANDSLTASLAATIPVTVVAVNDVPVVVGNLTLQVPFNNSGILTTAMLDATDLDNTPAELLFTAVTSPNQGRLLLDGVVMAAGGTFTIADVAGGRLVYEHGGLSTTDDVFAVRVSDGATNSDLHIFTIDVTSSEAPTMTATTIAIACNRVRTVTLPIVDPYNRQVTMTSLAPLATKGTVTIGAPGSNRITYQPDLDARGDDSFGLHLVNSNGDSTDVVVQVRITDPGEAQPRIVSTAPMLAVEGERFYYEPVVDREGLVGGTLVWELTAPAGPNFSATTGVVNWPVLDAPADGSGYHIFHLLVIDDVNHVAGYQPILFKVLPAASPAPQ